MKEVLLFLEKDLQVSFQYVLLKQEVYVKDKSILKTCYSKKHNTRHICVKNFYKRTF